MTTEQTQNEQNETSDEVLAKTAQQTAQSARTLALHISQHDDMEALAEKKAAIITERVIAELESAQKTAVDKATEEAEEKLKHQFQVEAARILDDFDNSLKEAAESHADELRNMLLTLEKSRQVDREEHQRTIQEVQASIAEAKEQADRRRTELEKSHEDKISEATEVIRAEREKQLAEYDTLRSETTTHLQEMTEGALIEHSRSIDGKLEQNSLQTDQKLEQNDKEVKERFTEAERVAVERKTETDEALAKSEARWRRTAIITSAAAATALTVAIATLSVALL